MSNSVYIFDAIRSPIGNLGGALSTLTATDLISQLCDHLKKKHNLKPNDIKHIVLGNVLSAGLGQNIARQLINTHFDTSGTAFSVNMVCGSGLKAVCLADQSIRYDNHNLVLAGGTESMSNAPYLLKKARFGYRLGDDSLIDSVVSDGLWDCQLNYHMGQTAENIAKQKNISREEQDLFAYTSQQKTKIAIENNKFADEIVPILVRNKKEEIEVKIDEFPKPSTCLEKLNSLRPAFNKEGSVTAGNASGINDGAALLMLGSETAKNQYKPLAKIVSYAETGVAAEVMGLGPIEASKIALKKANWTINDIDLVESNEAFAVQSIAVQKELNIPEEKINVNGGAIALGHPIGASGARILVTLIHELKKQNKEKGLATLCIGGGMGIAMCIQIL